MHKKLYLSILAAIFTAAAIVLFLLFAAPVAAPFAWAMIIGISTMPHYKRFLRWWPGHPGRCAGLMVTLVLFCFIIPIGALVTTATLNANEWYQEVMQLISTFAKTGAGTLSRFPILDRLSTVGHGLGVDISEIGGKIASASSQLLVTIATEAAKNIFNLFFTLAVALFMLFFIYRDGERIVATIIARVAPNREKAEQYVTEIRSITTAVTVGTILTCCAQGVTAGLGYWIAGVPAPIFCGALTAIAALVPVVGTGVIWVPLVVVMALNGDYLKAVLLAAWCMIFVGFADNAIRPLAIGAAKDIPVLAIVLGAICGVITMGLLGLILGPVLFAVLMTMWRRATADVGQVEHSGEASTDQS